MLEHFTKELQEGGHTNELLDLYARIERVITPGFGCSFTSPAWRGDISGRIPLLKHDKALIINTPILSEEAYRTGLHEFMRSLIDESTLHCPGVRTVEHEYFYAVNMADAKALGSYLDRAYRSGRDFSA